MNFKGCRIWIRIYIISIFCCIPIDLGKTHSFQGFSKLLCVPHFNLIIVHMFSWGTYLQNTQLNCVLFSTWVVGKHLSSCRIGIKWGKQAAWITNLSVKICSIFFCQPSGTWTVDLFISESNRFKRCRTYLNSKFVLGGVSGSPIVVDVLYLQRIKPEGAEICFRLLNMTNNEE